MAEMTLDAFTGKGFRRKNVVVGMKPEILSVFEVEKTDPAGAVFKGKTDFPEFDAMQQQVKDLELRLIWKRGSVEARFKKLETGAGSEDDIQTVHTALKELKEASAATADEIDRLFETATDRERRKDLLKHKEGGGKEEEYEPSDDLEQNLMIWDNTANHAKATANHILGRLEEEGIIPKLEEIVNTQ
ncbi:hypothetical protein ACFLQ2_05450 [archaeon]